MKSASSLDVSRTGSAAAVAPQIGETPTLELLHKDAQPGPVPQQDFAPRPLGVHKKVQLAAHRIRPQLILDDADQTVVALA